MKLIDFTIKIAEKAGKLLLKESKKAFKVREKSVNNLVTDADFASEKFITTEILKKFPDHAILAEESSFQNPQQLKKLAQAEYIWIIDPLDGTTNFAHRLPQYAVSIAVFHNKARQKSKNFQYLEGEIILGVIHSPVLKETFSAEKGKGARLNGKKIEVSKTKTVSKSLTVTGFPPTNREINLPYFLAILNRCQALRRLGSAALDLAYVAAGRFDLFWEFGLSPWDIAAGALIVEEAGGRVSDTNDNLLDLFGKDILATNGRVHPETVAIFEKL